MTYLPDKEYRGLALGSVELFYARGRASAKVSVEYTNRKGDIQPLVLRITDISLDELRCIARSIWEVLIEADNDLDKTREYMRGEYD